MVPALTQEIARQGRQVLQEGVPGRQGLAHHMVLVIGPPQPRMEQKREEVQRASHGGQVLLSMAVVMFAGIAVGVQGMGVRVRDCPAGSSGLHDALHRSTSQVVRRRQRMAIPEGAVSVCRDGAFTPIDPQRVFPLTPGDVVGIAIGGDGANAPMPTTDGERLEISGAFYPNKPRIQRGVRRWLAHHDTVAGVPEYPFTQGLLAVQLVPSDGHVRRPSGLPLTPSLRRALFAILFRMAILRRDELGLQGHHLGVPRGDDHGGAHVVHRGHWAVALGALGAAVARNGRRRTLFRARERDEPLPRERATRAQRRRAFQGRRHPLEHGKELGRVDGIEPGTALMITGPLAYPNETGGMAAPFGLPHRPRIRKEGGRRRQKDGPRAQRRIVDRLRGMLPLPAIGQRGELVVEGLHEVLKRPGFHPRPSGAGGGTSDSVASMAGSRQAETVKNQNENCCQIDRAVDKAVVSAPH